MIGLLYIAFFAVYLWLTVFLVKRVVRAAKKRSIAGWKWGVPMALVMYLLVFWDWVPTVVAHKHYCEEYGGFTIEKTLDEWISENPGIAEALIPIEGGGNSFLINGLKRHPLNQRFAWDVMYGEEQFGIFRREEHIVDIHTEEVLARYVNFSTRIDGIIDAEEIRDFKVWMSRRLCEPEGGGHPQRMKFNGFFQSIKYAGVKNGN